MTPVLLSLEEWGGTSNGNVQMQLPAIDLIPHHSVTNEELGVHPTADAIADFRELDNFGVGQGHGGVSYSYMIHPEGVIGEGQGTRRGTHTGGIGCNWSPWGWNPCTFGVCFIGDYQPREGVDADTLTDAAIQAYRYLRDLLILDGLLVPGVYPTRTHRDMPGNSTACAGDNIEDRMAELAMPYQQPLIKRKGADHMFVTGNKIEAGQPQAGDVLAVLYDTASGVVCGRVREPGGAFGFGAQASTWISQGAVASFTDPLSAFVFGEKMAALRKAVGIPD